VRVEHDQALDFHRADVGLSADDAGEAALVADERRRIRTRIDERAVDGRQVSERRTAVIGKRTQLQVRAEGEVVAAAARLGKAGTASDGAEGKQNGAAVD